MQVDSGNRPVTGIRLFLEGKKNDRLGVHLQHLSTSPTFIAAARHDKPLAWRGSEADSDDRFYEPVQWRMFARVSTAPVKYDPGWLGAGDRDGRAAWVVTGARLHVAAHDGTDVLHLGLLYAELPGCAVVQSRWARGAARLSGKSSFLSASVSAAGSSGGGSGGLQKDRQQQGQPEGLNIDSGVFAGGPPVPVAAQRMLRLVDTSQVTMGPQDSPGYWLVTGARLDVDNGRISLHVKFSLLAPAS